MQTIRQFIVLFAVLVIASLKLAYAELPAYSIYNDTATTLYFDTMDPARGSWRNQSVNPHQNKKFTINSGLTSAKIRIGTPARGYNEYTLGTGGVYRLTWSDAKQMWDVTADQQAYNAAVAYNQQNPGYNPSKQSNLPYRLGDAVMVLWKGKWYASTVIQLGKNKVKIHYDNYDSSWDEWVEAARIRYR